MAPRLTVEPVPDAGMVVTVLVAAVDVEAEGEADGATAAPAETTAPATGVRLVAGSS